MIYSVISSIPIIFALLAMSVLKWGAIRSIGISFIMTLLMAFFIWHLNYVDVISYMFVGVFETLNIVLIIFGAILLLNFLTKAGAVKIINTSFTNISKDSRVQIILIGLVFNTFLCGIAAFGTEVALSSLVLIALGCPALLAAIVALSFNGPLVTFGAVGAPTIAAVQQTSELAKKAGLDINVYSQQVSTYSAFIHLFTALAISMIIMFVVTNIFGKEKSLKAYLEILPFLLLSTLSVIVPYFITAKYLGPDLPAVVGGITGFIFVISAAKLNFLIPKNIWTYPPKETWHESWNPTVTETKNENLEPRKDLAVPSLFKSWLPYIACSVILIVTRIPALKIQPYFKQPVLHITHFLGLEKVNFDFPWLYTPGIMPFVAISLLCIFLYKLNMSDVKEIFHVTWSKSRIAIIALVLSVMMVKIMINSSSNTVGLPGMIDSISQVLSQLKGVGSILVAPILGMLGTFVSGSNTTSNILFSAMEFNVASLTGLPHALLVSIQNTSGGLGDIFCIKSIVIVTAVTGLLNREGLLIRYALLVASIAALVLLIVSFAMLMFL